MKKAPTMDLSKREQSKEQIYSKVSERLKIFRSENPRALIETTPSVQSDGSIMFKARILKDKSDEYSPESIGHALSAEIDSSKKKAFEKLETIAVGRALAFIGYSADGEIASSEEMEEYENWKQEKENKDIEDAVEKIENCKTLDELKEAWKSLGKLNTKKLLIEAKENHPLYPKK